MLNEILKHTGSKGSFRRNTLIMSGGAIVNVIISMGLYSVIARLYTKEQFGELGLFMAVSTLLSLGFTSLYPTGLVVPKFKKEFFALLKLSLYLSFFGAVLSLIFIFLFRSFFINIFQLESISSLIYLIPIGVLLFSLKDVFFNWNIRNKDFKLNASSSIYSSISLKGGNVLYALIFGSSTMGFPLVLIIKIGRLEDEKDWELP